MPPDFLLFLALPFARANPKDEAFEKIAKDYVEGELAAHPESATELGDHRFDDQLTDYSAEARQRQLIRARQIRDALKQFEDYQLTGPNQVDVRILRENVENEIFELEDLKEPDWNPLVYNESLANSLYLLVSRDFAPAGTTHSKPARPDGSHSARDLPGEKESATSAAYSYRDSHRTDRRRDQSGPGRVSILSWIRRRK